MRKYSVGVDPKKTVTWNNGRRTVTKSYTTVDKWGEIHKHTTSHTTNVIGILKAVFLILLVGAFISVFVGAREKTFYSLLVMLQEVPEIIPAEGIQSFFNLVTFEIDFPSWLFFLEPVWNVISSLLVLLAFVVKGVSAALSYLIYFCKWLFI